MAIINLLQLNDDGIKLLNRLLTSKTSYFPANKLLRVTQKRITEEVELTHAVRKINPLELTPATEKWLQRLITSYSETVDFTDNNLFLVTDKNDKDEMVTEFIKLTDAISYQKNDLVEINPLDLKNQTQKEILAELLNSPSRVKFPANTPFLVGYSNELGKSVLQEVKLTDTIEKINPLKQDKDTEKWLERLFAQYPKIANFTTNKILPITYEDIDGTSVTTLIKLTKPISAPVEINPFELDRQTEKSLKRLFASRPENHFHANKPIVFTYRKKTGETVTETVKLTDQIKRRNREHDPKQNRYEIYHEALDKKKGVFKLKTYAELPHGFQHVHDRVIKERSGDISLSQALREVKTLRELGHLSAKELQVHMNPQSKLTRGIIMELVEGENLWQFLSKNFINLSIIDKFNLCIALLKEYERRITRKNKAHLDIKPENIIISRRYPYDFDVTIVDVESAANLGEWTTVAGTLPYMDPEMLSLMEPNGRVSGRSILVKQQLDIYSFGKIFQEIWCGARKEDNNITDQGVLGDLINSMTLLNHNQRPNVDKLIARFQEERLNYLFQIHELTDEASKEIIANATKKAEKDKEILSKPAVDEPDRESIYQQLETSLNELGNNQFALSEYLHVLDIPELKIPANKQISISAILANLKKVFDRYDKNFDRLIELSDAVERVNEQIQPGDRRWFSKELENLTSEINRLGERFLKKKDSWYSFASVLELNNIFSSRFANIAARTQKWEKAKALIKTLEAVKSIQEEIKIGSENTRLWRDIQKLSDNINAVWKEFENKQAFSATELNPEFSGRFAEIATKWQKVYESYFWNCQLPAELRHLQSTLKPEVDALASFKKEILAEIKNYHQQTQKLNGLFYLYQPPDVERIGTIKRTLQEIKRNEKNYEELFSFVAKELTTIKGGVFGNSRLKKHLQLALDSHPIVPQQGSEL